MTELEKLKDRLFNHPTKKCVNFSFTPGPKATPESVCREINKALDEIERKETPSLRPIKKCSCNSKNGEHSLSCPLFSDIPDD